MPVLKPSSKEEYKKMLETDKLVIVDFYADWCGPCKMIAPKLQAMSEEFKDTAVVIKVDVDALEDVAMDAGVSAMPTFHAYRNSTKVGELVGANEAKLREMFSK